MAIPFLVDLDIKGNSLLNVKIESLSAAPNNSPENEARIIYNETSKKLMFHNGTTWLSIEDSSAVAGVATLAGTSPIQVDASTGDVTVSILAASDSNDGSMSSTDKIKLDAATNANTVSTIVMRDGSGNFTAGTITANLTGTASNASQLNSQDASYYLDRENHSGTQLAATISDFDTQVQLSRLDQMTSPTSNVSFNNQRITTLADPVEPGDAANKAYVDAARSGLDSKESVRVASTEHKTLSGTQEIDDINVSVGDRVLIKNQNDPEDNGIYVVASGAWTRATDANTNILVNSGMFTFVEEGTENANTGWVLSTPNPIDLGNTHLVFVKFSSQGEVLAGDGLSKTNNTLTVVGTDDRISVGATGVDIASTYVGQTTITTLGTITTGTWQGTTIAANQGGTGQTTYSVGDILYASATSTLSKLAGVATGNALISGGIGAAPSWGKIGLTTHVDGTLPATSGGTGFDSFTTGNYLRAATTTTLEERTPVEVRGDIGATTVGGNIFTLTNPSAISFIRINANNSVDALSAADFKSALSLNDVENTALSTWAGSTNITTLGTVTTGTWNGTQVAVSHGGTGATTAADARENLGATTKITQNVGNGTDLSYTVTHNLNSRDVQVYVYEADEDYQQVFCDVEHTNVNAVTVRFSQAPDTNEYRVVVVG